MTNFVTILLFFALTLSVNAQNAQEQSAVDLLNYKKENGLHTLSFDPTQFNPRIIAPQGEGVLALQPSKMIDDAGALAGINGGFYRYGNNPDVSPYKLRYAQNFWEGGLSLLPTAILKTEQGLLGDTTGDNVPAIGWSHDGSRVALGYLKVQWYLKDLNSRNSYPVRRVTDLDHRSRQKYFYSNDKRFEIEYKSVKSVQDSDGEKSSSSNSFVLQNGHDDSVDFQVDDRVEIAYEWIEEKTWSKDNRGFQDLDYVISGGDFLVEAGTAHTEFDERNKPYEWRERVVICVHEDSKWEYLVHLYGVSMVNFAQQLKSRGCHYAINMDGGWSSTMHFSNEKLTNGRNRLVSDSIAVMPKRETEEPEIFDLIRKRKVDELYTYIGLNSFAAKERNHLQQSPLQLLVDLNLEDEKEEKMQKMLLDSMSQEDLLVKDLSGQSTLDVVLRGTLKDLVVRAKMKMERTL